MSDDKKKGGKGKNPWGNNKSSGGSQRPSSPPPRKSNYGSNDDVPDLDAMLKKAKDDFGDMIPGNLSGGTFGLLITGILLAVLVYLSAFIVKPGEHAVIQRFGAWERTITQEGLGFKFPWPVESLSKVKVNEIRTMNIGFLDALGRGNSQIRDLPEESLMLTSDRNIVDIDLVIQWNIKSAEDYVFNIKDQESTIKKVAESAIREEIGQTNMFPIITTERASVANATKEIIQKNLDEYNSGVNVNQVLIQRAEVHPDVQQAFQDVQSAKQDAEDVQNRARAYREDIIPKARGAAIQLIQDAEGYKQSTVAQSTGDAERFNSIYQAYLSGQDVTKKRIYIETMEDVLSNAQKIILDSEGNGSGVVPYLPLNELKPAAGASNRAPQKVN
jgi:membrane protease subunit HflK